MTRHGTKRRTFRRLLCLRSPRRLEGDKVWRWIGVASVNSLGLIDHVSRATMYHLPLFLSRTTYRHGYILHDTWILSEVSSIILMRLAFIFRLRALPNQVRGGQMNPETTSSLLTSSRHAATLVFLPTSDTLGSKNLNGTIFLSRG